MPDWDSCEHQWRISTKDWDSFIGVTEVECVKCGVPGERDDTTGDVYWPAT